MKVALRIANKDHRNYLSYLFPTDNTTGSLIISRSNDIGLLLCALVRYSDTSCDKTGDDIIKLQLPQSAGTSSAETKYCYYTLEAENKISDYIKAFFNMDFDRYWINGIMLGINKKDIIISYLDSRNICGVSDYCLSKRTYRHDIKHIKHKVKQYYDRANYIDNKIKENIKTDIKFCL